MFCSPPACCGDGRTPLLPGRKPILCYVTDRRAFEAVPVPPDTPLGSRASIRPSSLRDSIRLAIAAGAGWIQIREKDLDARSLVELARFAVTETRRSPRVFWSMTGWMSR